MFIVKIATSLTRSVTDARLRKAEKKNTKAMRRLHKAKGNLLESNIALASTQVEVAAQLTKLTALSKDIGVKMSIQSEKQSKLTQLLESL